MLALIAQDWEDKHPKGEDDGPHQVVLLLNGQGPQVTEGRGRLEGDEVVGVLVDQQEVLAVAECAQEFVAPPAESLGIEGVAPYTEILYPSDSAHCPDDDEERGKEAKNATAPKQNDIERLLLKRLHRHAGDEYS